jgi:hypothetical protein
MSSPARFSPAASKASVIVAIVSGSNAPGCVKTRVGMPSNLANVAGAFLPEMKPASFFAGDD